MIYALNDNERQFPDTNLALKEPNGLLAAGGDLTPTRLITAYNLGIFPWFAEGDPILWWSPEPRAIIKLSKLKINRTLKKFLKKNPFTVTINTSFQQVITECADESYRQDGTWILPEMVRAYCQLHSMGYAHSIEVWENKKLVGGLYGIAINGYFSGESMFHRADNASKVALVALKTHLDNINASFIDCQIENPFLNSMGAENIDRLQFNEMRSAMINKEVSEDFWQAKTIL